MILIPKLLGLKTRYELFVGYHSPVVECFSSLKFVNPYFLASSFRQVAMWEPAREPESAGSLIANRSFVSALSQRRKPSNETTPYGWRITLNLFVCPDQAIVSSRYLRHAMHA